MTFFKAPIQPEKGLNTAFSIEGICPATPSPRQTSKVGRVVKQSHYLDLILFCGKTTTQT